MAKSVLDLLFKHRWLLQSGFAVEPTKYNGRLMSAQSPSSRDHFRRLLVLIAVATVDMIGGAMVFPLSPFYALKLHASPTMVGMIIASFFVAQLISAPLW